MFLKKNSVRKGNKRGFTLIEILLVMGIIAILATVVLVAVNPSRQFAQARDTQRTSHVNTLLNAIGQRIADHRGLFEEGCNAGAIPNATTSMADNGYNLYDCLIPTYISSLPTDPQIGRNNSPTDYDTGYTIQMDQATGRITIRSPHNEVAESIVVSR